MSTAVKHPQVTLVCKNAECRADFLGTWGTKHCARCRGSQRARKAWQGRRKYDWTPERDQLLRDHYRSNATAIGQRFFPGWPKWVITHRAAALGLCRTKEKPWTKADDAFLLEWAGVHTAQWMQRQLRNRTVTAIVVRLKRLHVSRRIQADGLTMLQLEQASGIDHRVIAGWVRSGRLPAQRRQTDREHDPYVFREEDIAEFVLKNPSSFRLDRVDHVWFMGLMRDAVTRSRQESSGDGNVARASKRRAAAAAASLPQVPCIGIDDQTPCEHQKHVVPRLGIPPRCPDCALEFRRRLRLEDRDRMRRIRASTAVVPLEARNAVGAPS